MRGRSSTLSGEVVANLAELLIGGKRSIILVFAIAAFSVTANLISDGLGVLLPGWRSLIVGLLFLLLFAGVIRYGLRWVASGMKLRVIQDDNPAQCKVLLLFLSPVGLDRSTAEEIARGTRSADIRQLGDRQLFRASWRMPLEAIAYHFGRLEKVVVIPSSDSPGKQDGTFRDLELFFQTVQRMHGNSRPTLLSPHAFGIGGAQGVDFEEAGPLVKVLEDTYQRLREMGYADYDLLIDITGGQKVPTVAGATVALDVGRRIQYVSLRDYKVRVYDFTVSSSR